MSGLGRRSVVVVFAVVVVLAACASARSGPRPGEMKRDKCPVCKSIVGKILKLDKTVAKDIHFSGGNPEGWTLEKEKFLGKYSMGEARLVEIMEHVCTEKDFTCADVRTDVEELVEEWWAMEAGERANLTTWLCYDKAKLCCPDGKFGPTCKSCPGGVHNVCNGHGKCVGEGSTSGSGHCMCDHPYTGKSCNKCARGHIMTETKTCAPCHPGCKGECTGEQADQCIECKHGYLNISGVCEDLDECTQGGAVCRENEYCSNTEGSFTCLECHAACKGGCFGPDIKQCNACHAGYRTPPEGTGCEDINECTEGEEGGAGGRGLCGSNTYCENTEGRYECVGCHSSCGPAGCVGRETKDCKDCIQGFEKNNAGECVAKSEQAAVPGSAEGGEHTRSDEL